MKQRKIPISMNEEQWCEALTLAEHFGLNDKVYGWFPTTVRLSIKLTTLFIEKVADIIPDMDDANLDLFFQSVKRSKKKRSVENKALIAINELSGYNPMIAESIAQLYQQQNQADKK